MVAELGGRQAGKKPISVENLKRAFAIVDPAIGKQNYVWEYADQLDKYGVLTHITYSHFIFYFLEPNELCFSDHIRMERNIRWAFSNTCSDLSNESPLPLRTLVARLASGDIERVGPRLRSTHRRNAYK